MVKFSMESRAEKSECYNYTTYHMRQNLTGDCGRYSSFVHDDTNELPRLTKLVVDKILAIRGVVNVRCHKYEICVEKAKAFDWNEIEPQIARIFTYLNNE